MAITILKMNIFKAWLIIPKILFMKIKSLEYYYMPITKILLDINN